LECTPWGNPTYNLFGWQKPCYLIQEGYASTFQELIETTEWKNYGRQSGNPKCGDCMVHCGHEPTAETETFGSRRGFLQTDTTDLLGARASAPLEAERNFSPVADRVDRDLAIPEPAGQARERVEAFQLPVVTLDR